jgi:hypothetical protein
MKKFLMASAILALSSVSAFAGGHSSFSGFNTNIGVTGQLGVGNGSKVTQGGKGNLNVALTGQAGYFNKSTVTQGGIHNTNFAGTLQIGAGNSSSISQN